MIRSRKLLAGLVIVALAWGGLRLLRSGDEQATAPIVDATDVADTIDLGTLSVDGLQQPARDEQPPFEHSGGPHFFLPGGDDRLLEPAAGTGPILSPAAPGRRNLVQTAEFERPDAGRPSSAAWLTGTIEEVGN